MVAALSVSVVDFVVDVLITVAIVLSLSLVLEDPAVADSLVTFAMVFISTSLEELAVDDLADDMVRIRR